MNKAKILISLLACTVGITGATSAVSAMPAMKTGNRSEHVLELQERLCTLGYFTNAETGYYGSVTAQSVREFQKDFKLPVNGIADSQTISKLTQQSKPKQSGLDQLARIIYSEARGESFVGQVAVGAVIMNRVDSSAFPDSIHDVVFQSGQFSAIYDGQYKRLSPNETAYRAAREALNGADPTKGALFYYNPKLASSAWSLKRTKIKKIGNHVFTS